MDNNMIIVLSAMIVNLVLSLVVPCLFKDFKQPFVQQIKQVFNINKQLILTSTVIVGIITYIALQMYPLLETQMSPLFENNLESLFSGNYIMPQFMSRPRMDNNQFKFLASLN